VHCTPSGSVPQRDTVKGRFDALETHESGGGCLAAAAVSSGEHLAQNVEFASEVVVAVLRASFGILEAVFGGE
jgi:hypothetical protein